MLKQRFPVCVSWLIVFQHDITFLKSFNTTYILILQNVKK